MVYTWQNIQVEVQDIIAAVFEVLSYLACS